MKIKSVKTAATKGHGMHLWVKVETDAGVTGIGECVHGGPQAIAIINALAPKLEGRDPFAIDAIFEDFRRSYVFDGGFAGALITALKFPLVPSTQPRASNRRPRAASSKATAERSPTSIMVVQNYGSPGSAVQPDESARR